MAAGGAPLPEGRICRSPIVAAPQLVQERKDEISNTLKICSATYIA
jgi:hypothetical protein